MAIDMELTPKTKRPAGEPCCEPVVYPDVERDQAVRMATVAKALGDPVRLQLVDVLRKHAGKVCVCELVPLFDLSQPTVSHHLKVLREAGIVGSERQGLWAYYFVIPDALKELSGMAELSNDCCSPAAQETCCEPADKASCCGDRHGSGCGCSAGSVHVLTAATATVEQVRETVREKYAAAAQAAAAGAAAGCCSPADTTGVFGASLYAESVRGARKPRSTRRSAAGFRPRSLTCTRARSCSTSAPAPALTC